MGTSQIKHHEKISYINLSAVFLDFMDSHKSPLLLHLPSRQQNKTRSQLKCFLFALKQTNKKKNTEK